MTFLKKYGSEILEAVLIFLALFMFFSADGFCHQLLPCPVFRYNDQDNRYIPDPGEYRTGRQSHIFKCAVAERPVHGYRRHSPQIYGGAARASDSKGS